MVHLQNVHGRLEAHKRFGVRGIATYVPHNSLADGARCGRSTQSALPLAGTLALTGWPPLSFMNRLQ